MHLEWPFQVDSSIDRSGLGGGYKSLFSLNHKFNHYERRSVVRGFTTIGSFTVELHDTACAGKQVGPRGGDVVRAAAGQQQQASRRQVARCSSQLLRARARQPAAAGTQHRKVSQRKVSQRKVSAAAARTFGRAPYSGSSAARGLAYSARRITQQHSNSDAGPGIHRD